jgi:hypothetical protein
MNEAELSIEKKNSRIERHIISVITIKGRFVAFTELYMRVCHNMDISDFRDLLNKMKDDGILVKDYVESDNRDSISGLYYSLLN